MEQANRFELGKARVALGADGAVAEPALNVKHESSATRFGLPPLPITVSLLQYRGCSPSINEVKAMSRTNISCVAASVAAIVTLSAGGLARADDRPQTLDASGSGTRSFMLSASHDTARLNFDQPQEFRLCNETERTNSRPSDSVAPIQTPSHSTPVGLSVSTDSGEPLQIPTGQCVNLVGQDLTVSTTTPLPGDLTLSGTVMAKRMTWKLDEARMRAKLADIRDMLQRDDETVLATKAEMDRAQDSLGLVARELNAVSTTLAAANARPNVGVREASAANDEKHQRE